MHSISQELIEIVTADSGTSDFSSSGFTLASFLSILIFGLNFTVTFFLTATLHCNCFSCATTGTTIGNSSYYFVILSKASLMFRLLWLFLLGIGFYLLMMFWACGLVRRNTSSEIYFSITNTCWLSSNGYVNRIYLIVTFLLMIIFFISMNILLFK